MKTTKGALKKPAKQPPALRAAARAAGLTQALPSTESTPEAWQHLRAFVAARKECLNITGIGKLADPALSRAQALALLCPPVGGGGMRVALTATRLAQLQAVLQFLCGYDPAAPGQPITLASITT